MEVRYDDFWINGVSARSKGITTVDPLQPPPMAARRYSDYQVGSDTDLIVSDDGFDDIRYSITVRVIGKPESLDNAALYAYLAGAQTLRISRLPLYEFRIRKVSGISPQSRNKGNEMTYTVTFELSPWKYVAFEPAITVSESGTNVRCEGTRFCKPLYKLTLSAYTGTGAFTVNGQQVTIVIPENMGTDTLYIDSDKQIAYDGSQNPQMRTPLTSGIFPWMSVGNNSLTFGGIISAIQVTRRQRCY